MIYLANTNIDTEGAKHLFSAKWDHLNKLNLRIIII